MKKIALLLLASAIALSCGGPARQQKVDRLLAQPVPDTARGCYERALDFKTLSEFGYAIRYLTKAIQIDPSFTEAYIERADIYITQQSYKRARADIKKVQELEPENPKPNTKRGILLFYLGHDETAEQEFKESIRKDPDYAEPYAWLGALYHTQGILYDKPEYIGRAIQYYNDFLTYDSESVMAGKVHFQLGSIYFLQHRWDECESQWRKAQKIEPRPHLKNWLALVRKARGAGPEGVAVPRELRTPPRMR